MYWSDWSTGGMQGGKIERAWMDGRNRDVFVENNLQWPNGLSIDYVDKKLYWCDAYLHKIERIGLDGSNREASIPMCITIFCCLLIVSSSSSDRLFDCSVYFPNLVCI